MTDISTGAYLKGRQISTDLSNNYNPNSVLETLISVGDQ